MGWLSFFLTSLSNFHYELAGMDPIYKFIKMLVLSLDEPVLASPRHARARGKKQEKSRQAKNSGAECDIEETETCHEKCATEHIVVR
jgi:hypothetical protein